jgi:6-pyruvoyltetrahydropterin/6-carboxytetrahydropterin synthase
MFEVTVEETFAAGHALRGYRGKCENVHGHNYKVQVTLEGAQLDAVGLLVDFVEVKRILHAAVERLDHQFLNDVPPFDVINPSAENMAKHLYDEIHAGLQAAKLPVPVEVAEIRIWETDTSVAAYRP